MRLKKLVTFSTLGMFALTLSLGCGESTDVKVQEAPAPTPVPSKPLPKEVKKGGGPSSSGNLGRNPGADPLAPR
jgi:hypothetical protein